MEYAVDKEKNIFSGEVDPEIAELMGIEDDQEASPDFDDLFGTSEKTKKSESETVDLSIKTFKKIEKLTDKPKPIFEDKEYYKKALSGGGEAAQRLHEFLSKFLAAKDPQERSMWRGKVIPAYWNFLEAIAASPIEPKPVPKTLLFRYGAVLPSVLSPEQKSLISSIIFENNTGEPIHYMDEWLTKVATGSINPSATDEVKVSQRNDKQKILQYREKLQGQKDAAFGLLRNKLNEVEALEERLKNLAEQIFRHDIREDMGGLKAPFNASQRLAMNQISDILRQLAKEDKEVERGFNEIADIQGNIAKMQEKASEFGDIDVVDRKVVINELNSLRQMAKMCVGRQGNHFPILMKQYFRAAITDIATRENIINMLAFIEGLDPELFLRTFKQQTNRIVPHIILLPCYGDSGICWEPFERHNRAASRGRLAIPMFPKDLLVAVLSACADLRWQVAKEKAQHYWMEEGLTGYYYQWFSEQKLKGDVREFFIQDYILWISKESEAQQKLNREVRNIFWRYIPFPQDVKDKLKNRGFVYTELYKKDQNRAMSDGY